MSPRQLGDRIREERERAGLTQSELAALVGVTPRSVGNWERGEMHPRNSLTRLTDVLPGLLPAEPEPARADADARVLNAIAADARLNAESRDHLIAQYRLLLSLQQPPAPPRHSGGQRQTPRAPRVTYVDVP